ncbi:MAG: hypothetical protein LLF89_10440 [Spirochaetaceae bacterium]|nr:hypothetical protein [Spirochaetaceae bacterium]
MAHSKRKLTLELEPEIDRMEVSEKEIDLVWSVFPELIRLANIYSPECD